MDEAEIDGVLADLQRLVGAPLAQVWQPARDRVVLGWRDGTLLLMVPRGPLARLHTVGQRPENPPKPYSFQGACRARLKGALRALERVPGERVVRATFDGGALELRLTGRSGGLWLLDGGQVVASLEGPAPETLPPLPERGERRRGPRFAPGAGQTWDEAARAYFEAEERRARTAELRGRVQRGLGRVLTRHARLIEHLHQDLERADAAPALRHRADLLTANLWRASSSTRVLDVEDWTTGERVTLTLPDDVPTPAKAAERWFQQARRLERMGEHVLVRIDQAERELRDLRERAARLDDLTLDELEALERALPRDDRRGAPPVAARPWDEWTGPAGERVRVGRHEAGNRRLVFQASRGYDWWLHLRDRPSAHAVLSLGREAAPTLAQLLAASQILMQRSGLAPGEPHDVQYTRVRNVRAVPGEGARVTVSEEKVLRVTSAPEALAGWSQAD